MSRTHKENIAQCKALHASAFCIRVSPDAPCDRAAHVPCSHACFAGTCGGGVADVYRNNATLGNSVGNVLWAGRDTETDDNGTFVGTAPNIFFPRQNATAAGGALRSLLLMTEPDAST